MSQQRTAIVVGGIVQGVGFRPFVCRTARRWELGGFVRNRAGDVLIEVEGERESIEQFLVDLRRDAPPLAQISSVAAERAPMLGATGFEIMPSNPQPAGDIALPPDVATCPACLGELFDPRNRRHRYPFINCTDCGPRLTIIRSAPYDRSRTTMAAFEMCPACRAEYEDPGDRRYHAQPNACPDCGPSVTLKRPNGKQIATDDPVAHFAQFIKAGGIGAMKGLGGYHLVCDATNSDTVRELRRRKRREEKPLAVMVGACGRAAAYCAIDAQERELLESPRRPIVLLERRAPGVDGLDEAAGPNNPYLGVLLPYTPLHHLLMHDIGATPLVMTSGNLSDEPIIHQDSDALERLGGVADLLLTHDRPIHVRCDDSVTRIVVGKESPIRRARGYTPEPVRLPLRCEHPLLAVGGQMKGAFALASSERVLVSHHLGDLVHLAAARAFERDVALYEEVFDLRPEALVHDLHPDYTSTDYARRRAAAESLPLLAVQHHHAHLASCLAEHGLDEPVIGVTFDGSGHGADGAVWGGEFLVGGFTRWRRAARLRYVRLPGGDRAAREPWRMAVSYVNDAAIGLPDTLSEVPEVELRVCRRMVDRGFNSPWTSSAGRLFDAVAALVGLRSRVGFEGQAAMELEWLASEGAGAGDYPFAFRRVREDARPLVANRPLGWDPAAEIDEIDSRPLIRAVARDLLRGVPPQVIAERFHRTMTDIVRVVCERVRHDTGLETVALSGGVFQNTLLLNGAKEALEGAGFRVLIHRIVPTNDGGLCLGQAAVAAACLSPDAAATRASSETTQSPHV